MNSPGNFSFVNTKKKYFQILVELGYDDEDNGMIM
tara:strand:- start:2014 stop:2118 length:105 start_codon:yes stop_codon:yes gene_type:complete